jgi:hypothetical protein
VWGGRRWVFWSLVVTVVAVLLVGAWRPRWRGHA